MTLIPRASDAMDGTVGLYTRYKLFFESTIFTTLYLAQFCFAKRMPYGFERLVMESHARDVSLPEKLGPTRTR